MSMRELRGEWCAQWTRGNNFPVADPAPFIDDKQAEILVQRRILKPVIHDDDACASRESRSR